MKLADQLRKNKEVETYRGYVMADEVDSNNHMNVQYYTKKFDIAVGQLLARLGFNFEAKLGEGIGLVYVESTIRYIKEVLEDTPLHINSEITEIANKVVTVKHSMMHSVHDTLHSECVMKWVFFDKKERKAVPVPNEYRETLKLHMNS